MAEPFLGEVRIMSFNFPPKGWALCNGQTLPINQNQALFSLLGTQFGGNGQTTFNLPDLRGCVPIHMASGFVIGQRGGEYAHTIQMSEMAQHNHLVKVATAATGGFSNPTNRYLGGGNNAYKVGPPTTNLQQGTLQAVGGSQAHENTQPYLVASFCIALQGIFPSQN